MSTSTIPTPDFETYPLDCQVAFAAVDEDVVRVTWVDGRVSRYHFPWLRDNDASEKSIDATSHERTYSVLDIPADIHPRSVGVSEAGGLEVAWSDGVASHYHPGWLRHFDYDHGARPETSWSATTWGRSLEEQLPLFSATAVFEVGDTRYDFLLTLRRLGLAIVTDMPRDRAAFERISSQIGLLRDMNWGKIFEIEPRPEGEYIANRGIPLDAHSDAATREHMPGFQIFQCVENTSPGGESFWVDGFHIARILQAEHSAAWELLSTVPWEQASRSTGSHYRWTAPIFELDGRGDITAVRDTTWLREPLCVDFDLVPQLYEAYRLYSSLKAKRENQVERKLVGGDVAFVDNRRVLHGRRAFDPSSGRRHIRTSYGEREELQSSIRMIERARAARAAAAG